MDKRKTINYIFRFILLLLVTTPVSAEQERYYIQVKSTKLRSAPQHFAPAVTELKLADSVTGSEVSDGWFKVTTASKKTGYLHKATLSDKKIVNSLSKGYNPKTDSSDVVLAGKGFNKEVEKDFSRKNPDLNFTDVNQMDKIKVNDSDLISFVKSGGLNKNG